MNMMEKCRLCWVALLLYLSVYPFLPETMQRSAYSKYPPIVVEIALIGLGIMHYAGSSVHRRRPTRRWRESDWYLLSAAVYFVVAVIPAIWCRSCWKELLWNWNQVSDRVVLQNPQDLNTLWWCCSWCSLGFCAANIVRRTVYAPDERFWKSMTFGATPMVLAAIALIVWSAFGLCAKTKTAYPFYPLSGGVSFILGFFGFVPERVLAFIIGSLARLFPT